jgi:hypothetical protein
MRMIKQLVRLQQYSGIVGVVVLWSGITTAMIIANLKLIDIRPISYLGVAPKTSVLFSLTLLINSFLFVNFAFFVRRRFNIRNNFLLYFLIGETGQVIVAIAPYGTNSPYKLLHTISAFVLAFSLPFLIREFYLSQKKSRFAKLYLNLLKVEILTFVVGIGAFVFTNGVAPLGEALPTMGFHLWIVVVSVIAITNKDLVTSLSKAK